jgi:hypothetical protein
VRRPEFSERVLAIMMVYRAVASMVAVAPAWILVWTAAAAWPAACAGQTTGLPVVLFDGASTRGWTRADGQPHEGWVVQDGALFRKSGGGDLFHEGTWRDFVLYFQWKISTGGNSGLKYRVRQYGRAWLGCEYQILDDQNARERNKSGYLYDVYEASPGKPVMQPEVWQQGKIVVCGNRLEHWLNGVLIVQADTSSEDWKRRVAASKFRSHEGFGANREGRIFLQDHGNPVWFRQIILVPLNCDSVAVADLPPVIAHGGLSSATACCDSAPAFADGRCWSGSPPTATSQVVCPPPPHPVRRLRHRWWRR